MFGKAIKKPVEINFYEWDGDVQALEEWCNSFTAKFEDHFLLEHDEELKVKTLEGTSYAVPFGYVIIRGIEGEFYPCEPGIFAKTYQKI